jgi:hypothetical protein
MMRHVARYTGEASEETSVLRQQVQWSGTTGWVTAMNVTVQG